jgi:hypothetical protein
LIALSLNCSGRVLEAEGAGYGRIRHVRTASGSKTALARSWKILRTAYGRSIGVVAVVNTLSTYLETSIHDLKSK